MRPQLHHLALTGMLALAAACSGHSSPADPTKGSLRISGTAASFDTATGSTEICAHFTLQPYAPAADGTPQLSGNPVSFDSSSGNDNDASTSTDQILGCIDGANDSSGYNWGYIVTADTFSDCGSTPGTLGAGLTNVSPTTTTINVQVHCAAGLDTEVPIHVQVAVSESNQAGYVDISAGVNATTVQVGCKQADTGSDGLLHFGESFIASDGTIPLGLVGLDFGAPTQFGGTVNDATGNLDTYYTGDVALGQVSSVYQTFLGPCADNAEYADIDHAQCVSNSSGNPDGTLAELADAFAEFPGQGFAAVSISSAGLTIYSSMGGGPNIMNAATGSFAPAYNITTTTTIGASGYSLSGVFIDQSTALQFLIAATDGSGTPVVAILSYTGGAWTLGGFAPPTAANLTCNGLYSTPAGCFVPSGCAGGGAPADLSYDLGELDCTVGQDCELDIPTSDGGEITSYAISPALPAGLTFDTSTGAVSGTPTSPAPLSTYTVTATNSSGSTTTTVDILVYNSGPPNIAYSPNSLACLVDVACSLLAPTNTGGEIVSYSITPVLPDGVHLDPNTGAISGTPAGLKPLATYTVTATGVSGSATTQITVVASNATLTYSPNTLTCGVGVACSSVVPVDTGMLVSCTVTPALPSGLSINPATCVISGTPNALSAQTTYSVIAHNSSGSATSQFKITVAGAMLIYPSLTCTVGTPCALAAPTDTGGTGSSFSIAPTLSAGLSIDPSSGAISGTPTAGSAATTYTVNATDNQGAVSGTVAITVLFLPDHPTGNLVTARDFFTATLLQDGRVLIAGGNTHGNSGTNLANAELYDPGTGTFTATGNLNHGRCQHTATLLPNGLVLISGGQIAEAPAVVTTSNELYDPGTGTFTETTPMLFARYGHTSTLLPTGLVLLTGGEGAGTVSTSAELYNPANGHVTQTGSMHVQRGLHTATLLNNGLVLIAGSHNSYDFNTGEEAAELYDPGAGTFAFTGYMVDDRYWHTATLLANGQVLFAGGDHGVGEPQGTVTGSAEIYDPTSGTFTATGSLAYRQTQSTATLLPSGLVLIGAAPVNDDGAPPLQAQMQLFDPSTGLFSNVGDPTMVRVAPTATLLQNGRVLIAAGEEFPPGTLNGVVSNSAELYY